MNWKETLEQNGFSFQKKCGCSGWGEWWVKGEHKVKIRNRVFNLYKSRKQALISKVDMNNATALQNAIQNL